MAIGPHERARDQDAGDDLYAAVERKRLAWEADPTPQNEFQLWRAIKALDKHADYCIKKYNLPIEDEVK